LPQEPSLQKPKHHEINLYRYTKKDKLKTPEPIGVILDNSALVTVVHAERDIFNVLCKEKKAVCGSQKTFQEISHCEPKRG